MNWLPMLIWWWWRSVTEGAVQRGVSTLQFSYKKEENRLSLSVAIVLSF